MLESINDYLAIVAIIAVILLAFGCSFYVANINSIRKNLRKEMDYYHYDSDNLIKNSKDGLLNGKQKNNN